MLSLLDVEDKINIQVRRLSLGERMKMEIIAALLHRPKIVFLDEPTIGLDVTSQSRIRDFIKKYKGTSTSITVMKEYEKRALQMQETQIGKNIEEYLEKLAKKVTTNFQTSKLVTKEMSKIGNQKAKDSLFGNFPSHTKVRNIYFATLNAIITLGDVSEMICEGLLNVIFKLDLRKYTDKVASFQNESFHFTLITGIGMLAGDSTLSLIHISEPTRLGMIS